MDSEVHPVTVNEADFVTDTSTHRSRNRKKTQGGVPRKFHKAEREKLKRDHLNDLFFDLGSTLGLSQNIGKASILKETTRLLTDMLDQIESLKKENATLLSESNYVFMEKNELTEENSALEAEIGQLKSELEARVERSKANSNKAPPSDGMQKSHTMGPVLVIPLGSDFQNCAEQGPARSTVSKPHARYPNPGDHSWPCQLLGRAEAHNGKK